MPTPVPLAAMQHARELVSHACCCLDAASAGDAERLDDAARRALLAADAIRQAVRPGGEQGRVG